MAETKLRAGDIVEGEIDDLAYGGAGVLRAEGWVVMVRGAFPGDRARVRLGRRRKGLFEGHLEEILSPSRDRIRPACPHLAICGGCALQGLDPTAQTRYKSHQAAELLRRIGGIEPEDIASPWASPDPYYYRNKMEFTFASRAWLTREQLEAGTPFAPGPALGLHPRGVFQGVFDVTDCRLQSPLSNRVVEAMRSIARARDLDAYRSRADQGLLRHLVIRQAATTRDLIVILVVRSEHPDLPDIARELKAAVPEISGIVASVNLRRATVAQGDYDVPLLGETSWQETLHGLTFRIGAASFFQTQTRGGEALIEEALVQGGFGSRDRVLDLYCGIGAFSLPLARQVDSVLGVEIQERAIVEARANARANGIENARFQAGPVEARESHPWEAKGAWDAVLIDPPRSGLHPRALEKVLGLDAGRIVYVSCNPSTLARDAGHLVAEGGYRARRLRVFDLFPQTPHLESVLILEHP